MYRIISRNLHVLWLKRERSLFTNQSAAAVVHILHSDVSIGKYITSVKNRSLCECEQRFDSEWSVHEEADKLFILMTMRLLQKLLSLSCTHCNYSVVVVSVFVCVQICLCLCVCVYTCFPVCTASPVCRHALCLKMCVSKVFCVQIRFWVCLCVCVSTVTCLSVAFLCVWASLCRKQLLHMIYDSSVQPRLYLSLSHSLCLSYSPLSL